MYSNYFNGDNPFSNGYNKSIPDLAELRFGYTPNYSMGPTTELKYLVYDTINLNYALVSAVEAEIREKNANATSTPKGILYPNKYRKLCKYTFTKGITFPKFDSNFQKASAWCESNCVSSMPLDGRTKRPSMFNPTSINTHRRKTDTKIMDAINKHNENAKKTDVELEYEHYDGYESAYYASHHRAAVRYVKPDDDFEYCI